MSSIHGQAPETDRRMEVIEKTRDMILKDFQVEGEDDVSVILRHKGFFLQVLFSRVHPLIIIYLAKSLEEKMVEDYSVINDINGDSFMGSHSINRKAGCYAFRSTHWLEAPMQPDRFREILTRCSVEAADAHQKVLEACCK